MKLLHTTGIRRTIESALVHRTYPFTEPSSILATCKYLFQHHRYNQKPVKWPGSMVDTFFTRSTRLFLDLMFDQWNVTGLSYFRCPENGRPYIFDVENMLVWFCLTRTMLYGRKKTTAWYFFLNSFCS